MTETIEWLRIFLMHYPSFQYLIIFVVTAVVGEFGILALGFLAATNVISLTALVVVSFLASFIVDSLWFWIGKTKFARKIISHRYATSAMQAIYDAMHRVSRGSQPVALILAKFVTGTRTPMILHLSNIHFPFSKFFRYNTIATFLWLPLIIAIGFLSGLGFTYLSKLLKNAYAGIGFILLVVVLVLISQVWLKRRLSDQEHKE